MGAIALHTPNSRLDNSLQILSTKHHVYLDGISSACHISAPTPPASTGPSAVLTFQVKPPASRYETLQSCCTEYRPPQYHNILCPRHDKTHPGLLRSPAALDPYRVTSWFELCHFAVTTKLYISESFRSLSELIEFRKHCP
jgi:hypothetical protein